MEMRTSLEFAQQHWLGLTLALPVVLYAAWIASLVVPEIVKAVVPATVRAIAGS
jgi:hypothetical protein